MRGRNISRLCCIYRFSFCSFNTFQDGYAFSRCGLFPSLSLSLSLSHSHLSNIFFLHLSFLSLSSSQNRFVPSPRGRGQEGEPSCRGNRCHRCLQTRGQHCYAACMYSLLSPSLTLSLSLSLPLYLPLWCGRLLFSHIHLPLTFRLYMTGNVQLPVLERLFRTVFGGDPCVCP